MGKRVGELEGKLSWKEGKRARIGEGPACGFGVQIISLLSQSALRMCMPYMCMQQTNIEKNKDSSFYFVTT